MLQQFVEANEAFIDCMAAIPKDGLADMGKGQLDANCVRERNAIKSLLQSNNMTMTQVVKDRINVMKTLKEIGVPVVVTREQQ